MIPSGLRMERFLHGAVDIGERAFLIVLYAAFLLTVWGSLALRPHNILVLISETLVVLFVIVRRDARTITVRPLDWFIALAGTALPMMMRPGGDSLAPAIIGAAFMGVGLSISIWAKLILRRSFGIAAANRGVVQGGPYRFVRHPIYAGYVIVQVGFLLSNPLAMNFVIATLTAAFLVMRILAEERILGQDSAYVGLMDRVRYRLMPGIF